MLCRQTGNHRNCWMELPLGYLLRTCFCWGWSVRSLQIQAEGKTTPHFSISLAFGLYLQVVTCRTWFASYHYDDETFSSCLNQIFVIICHQSYMDSEIRAIMAQYMPLDNQEGANQQHHVAHADDIWKGPPFLEQHGRSVQHFTCAAASGQLGVKIRVVCEDICRTMYDYKRYTFVVHLFYDTGWTA